MAKYIPWNIMATSLSHWVSDIAYTCQEYVMGLGCTCVSCCPMPSFWWRHFCHMVTT